MVTNLDIRRLAAQDIPEMRKLFRATVLTVNSKDYTKEEVEDWASCGDSVEHWKELFAKNNHHRTAFLREAWLQSGEGTEGESQSALADKLCNGKGCMNILKSLIIWLCFIPVAILNGGLREYVLVKAIGKEWALPVSGITLSVCIFLITWLLLPRMIKAFTSKDGWLIGIGWALLTIAFEFAVGLAGGSTVSELLAAYNPLSGNLWLLVLVTTLLSPIIVKHIHNTIK